MISAKWINRNQLSDKEKEYISGDESPIFIIAYEDDEVAGYGSISFQDDIAFINSLYSNHSDNSNIMELILRMMIRRNFDSGRNYFFAREGDLEKFYIKFGFKKSTQVDKMLVWTGDVGGCC